MGHPYDALLDSRDFETGVVALPSGSTPLTLELDPSYRHFFAALEFYSDANGETVVIPTAGTATYGVVVPVSPNTVEPFTDNVKTLTETSLVSWAANATQVNVVLDSLAGSATHVRLRAVGNIS